MGAGINFALPAFVPGSETKPLLVITDRTEYISSLFLFINWFNPQTGESGQIQTDVMPIPQSAPEPATAGLLALGLGTLALSFKRMK